MKIPVKVKSGQPSWRLATREVEVFVTETGAHVGPVTFRIGNRKITPLSLAPWANETVAPGLPPLLKVLRGDFFCMPFGGNASPFQGERHPLHGETANRRWRCEGVEGHTLQLSLKTKTRTGQVDKYVRLHPGHLAVYQRHVISRMTGPMNFGHHAMLKFPDREGCGRLSTSRFVHGEVTPVTQEDPAKGGYSALRTGAVFRSLEKVPLQSGGSTDLTVYPSRRGFEDFAMIVSDERMPFAWTAVTFPKEGYVWFALKDPRVLRQTLFWISNGGRYYSPWNGRHRNVMGVEEVTTYWHGLKESACANPLSQKGHSTRLLLNPRKPLAVNYIMAVAPIPPRFDRVAAIRPVANGEAVELVSRSGRRVQAAIDLDFLEIQNSKTRASGLGR